MSLFYVVIIFLLVTGLAELIIGLAYLALAAVAGVVAAGFAVSAAIDGIERGPAIDPIARCGAKGMVVGSALMPEGALEANGLVMPARRRS